MIETLHEGQTAFTVSAEGISFIDPLSITDVVRAIKEVGLSSKCHEQTINLCRGEPHRVAEFVSLIAQSLATTITVNCDQEPETYPVNFWGDATKLQSLTHFRPSPLIDDIRHYADWIQQDNAL